MEKKECICRKKFIININDLPENCSTRNELEKENKLLIEKHKLIKRNFSKENYLQFIKKRISECEKDMIDAINRSNDPPTEWTGINKYYLHSADCIKFFNKELEASETEVPKPQSKKKIETIKPIYETIESIFYDTDNIEKIIGLLVDHEVLNERGEMIKDKFHIVAITEALVIKGIIRKDVSQTQRNILFASKVNSNIAEKTARTKGYDHEKLVADYQSIFKNL